ncbi:hypothetical protein CLH_2315 [Clostridium botulinum E3 str. Alaska E43]|nr:hypothetical protein CLH_2315 [Clostridium botulinum E3 str. Alaska E43]
MFFITKDILISAMAPFNIKLCIYQHIFKTGSNVKINITF